MRRFFQRDVLPISARREHLDIIKETETISSSATLAAGQDTVFQMTTQSNLGAPLIVQENISLFETSISSANLIPNGSNIAMSNYQIVGPWREQDSGDSKNIVSKIYVRNATSASAQDHKNILTNVNIDRENSEFRRKNLEISDGTLFFVYIDKSAGLGNYDLVYRTSSDNGVTWSSSTKIYDMIYGGSFAALVVEVIKDSSDNLYIVFSDDGASSANVKFVKLTRSGNSWSIGSINTIAGGTGASDSAGYPGITITPSGNLYYLYAHNDGTNELLKIKVSTDAGASFGSATTISNSNSNSKYASIVCRGNNPFVVWHEFDASGTMYFSEYTSSWSAPASVYNPVGNVTTTFCLCADNSNNIHLAVVDNISSPNKIDYLNYNGSAWSAKEDLTEGTTDNNHPVLSFDGTNLFLHWVVTTAGFGYGALKRKTRSGGSWGASSTVVAATDKPFSPFTSALYNDPNFIYCYYNTEQFPSEDNTEIYRDITGSSKTILFRGKTRYISSYEDVTIS